MPVEEAVRRKDMGSERLPCSSQNRSHCPTGHSPTSMREGTAHCGGHFLRDPEQRARRTGGRLAPLLPILHDALGHIQQIGKFALAEVQPGADLRHVDIAVNLSP